MHTFAPEGLCTLFNECSHYCYWSVWQAMSLYYSLAVHLAARGFISRHYSCNTYASPASGCPLLCRLVATIVCASAQIQMSLPRWSQAAVYGLRTGSAPRLPLPPMAQQKPHFANLLACDNLPYPWPACQSLNQDATMSPWAMISGLEQGSAD